MKAINLMKHTCTIELAGHTLSLPPSGTVAEVETEHAILGEISFSEGVEGLQVPIVTRSFSEVKGLPEPAADTVYLVSSMVLAAVPNRRDVFSPDSGNTAKRNEKGHVVSVSRLIGNV